MKSMKINLVLAHTAKKQLYIYLQLIFLSNLYFTSLLGNF